MATTREGFGTEDAPRGGPRGIQLALVALGVLLLLFLVWFFLLRAEEDPAETTASAPAPATAPTDPEQEAVEGTDRGPVETFEVFAPKDPFDPLVSDPVTTGTTSGAAVDGTATTDTTGGSGTVPDTTTGDGTGTATTTTTTTDPGGSSDGGSQVGGHRVRVIDVYRQGGGVRAQVQVDGTVYTVDEGERFAQNFQLMSASGQCATMLFGDDEFTLCEGEEILK